MRTRTKALLLTLCAVLLVATVFTTVAYLKSTDEVVNTFTVGKVKITLDEAEVTSDGTPMEGADRVKSNEYHLLPGHTYTKDPTVTVEKGSDESYIRMKVTFNLANALLSGNILINADDYKADELENARKIAPISKFLGGYSEAWSLTPGDLNMYGLEEYLSNDKYFVYDAEADTLTYYFYYTGTVTALDKDVKLPALFKKITVPDWVDGEELAALKDFKITVVAEAIQADGFENAEEAWAAFQ